MNQNLFLILSLLFGLIPITGETAIFLTEGSFNATAPVAFLLFVLLISNLLAFKLHNNFKIAKFIFCCATMLAITVAIFIDGGLNSPLRIFLIAGIFGCSFVVGKKGPIIFGGFSLLFCIVLLTVTNIAEDANYLQEFISLSMSLVVISILAFLYEKEKETNIEYSKRLDLLRKIKIKNTMLEEFTFVSAHDLKAPLRAISSLSDWLVKDHSAELPESACEDLLLIRDKSILMDKMIQSMLAYAIEDNHDSKAEETNLNELLEKIKSILEYPENFQIRHSPDLPTILTIPVPLEVVLRNLISNAIKHRANDHGFVEIKVDITNKDFILFTIADNGPGINEIHRDRVFKLFQTLEIKGKDSYGGIGLAIVKKNVELVGGKVWIENNLSSNGLKICFHWPKTINYAID